MADLITLTALTLDPGIMQGRLTLETGVAVSTTDQLAKTSVFLTPNRGNRLGLYDGTAWKMYALTADVTLPLGTLTSAKNYDIFGFDSSSNVALEFSAAWTNDTTRADALAFQDGILCKSGALTRRYLGTMRTVSTTQTADSGGLTGTTQVGATRFLWNYYNRVPRPLSVIDTTASWSYGTAAFRQAHGAAGNKVEYVSGIADLLVEAIATASPQVFGTDAAPASDIRVGLGVDSTTVNSAPLIGRVYMGFAGAGNFTLPMSSVYRNYPGLGYHALNWLEYGQSVTGGTLQWNGSGGGIVATIQG
jgi:hypothetical protein